MKKSTDKKILTIKKKCSKCGQEKLLAEFYFRNKSKKIRHSECKNCSKEKFKKWAAEHSEKFRKLKKKWAAEHPEKVRASEKKYRDKHSEEIREKFKKWVAEHSEKFRKLKKKWVAEHPEKVRASLKKYNKKQRDSLGRHYVKGLIKNKYKIPYNLITDDMIERERELIQINRLLRSKKDVGSKKII